MGQVGKGRARSLKDSLQLSAGPPRPGNLRWEAGVGGMCTALELSGPLGLELSWVAVSQYFFCFLFRKGYSFSQQFVRSAKAVSPGLSIRPWLAVISYALEAATLTRVF